MEIVVFGARGQLGRSIMDISYNYPKHHFLFTDIETLDITQEHQVANFVSKNYPQVFINCAAYTAVDRAQGDTKGAMDLNAHAVKNLAKIAAENNIFLVHISSDYIYDGKRNRPYRETDSVHPLSVYGRSKWKGEVEVMRSLCRSAIIRTSWLYSEYGTNFVKTILNMSGENEQLKVVCDQIGTPTYARDLAETIMQIVNEKAKIEMSETFHYSNEGVASWYDFAVEITRLSKRKCKVVPVSASKYPTSAKRPQYSVLCKDKIKETFGIEIPHWKESLERCLANMKGLRA
jgi:dTDP-4-dehydrorhamnose reductase